MQYFFNDHLRWNLGFDTPNQGGAMMAVVLPWLWGLTLFAFRRLEPSTGCKRWVWRLLTVLFVATECVATWALVKTYSRGALVGTLAALGLAATMNGWWFWRARRVPAGVPVMKTKRSFAACLAPWLTRGVLLAALLCSSDFTQRLAPDYATSDKSVTNRVDLWKGGLELIAISPLHGWGWGNSGASFMHWTQPIGRAEGYKSMVNSYLTVGVEGGLPVLAGVLTVCALVFSLGIRSLIGGGARCPQRDIASWSVGSALGTMRSTFLLAATTSWAAWLVCLFFSNLWIIPLLWMIPGVTAACLIGLAVRSINARMVRLDLVRIGILAAVASGGLWFAGAWLESRSPVQIIRHAGGEVELARHGQVANAYGWIVLPDSHVLGEAYGQELRRWVIASPQPLHLLVPASPDAALPTMGTVVAFGAACTDARLKGRTVMLIHPTLDPDNSTELGKGSRLQLAGIDVAQKNTAWTDWAARRGLVVEQSWGLATDVRPRWPELILALQFTFK